MSIEIIFKVCGTALLAVITLNIMKQVKAELVPLTRIAVLTVLFSVSLSLINPIISYIKELSYKSSTVEYIELLIRCLGVSLFTKLISDICNDSGEGTCSAVVQWIGGVQIINLSIPLIEKILSYVVELL